MALRTTFASYGDGLQPIPVALDAVLTDLGKLGVIPCAASGVDTILLTPVSTVYAPTISAYSNHLIFSFVAAGASTGSVTVNVGLLGAKNLYDLSGVQIGSGGLASATVYLIVYNAALNASAGGFNLLGTVAANSVGNSALRDSGALSVIGRSANSAGDPADISATAATDAVLRESGSVLGFGTIATAGIANNAVTDAKLRDSGALSVIGRSANSSGDPADISASAASGAVLRESGSTLGFGTIATAGIANDAVTYAKIQNVSATDMLLGRSTSGSGDVEEIACTAAGRALLDDAANTNQRTTLGLGTIATQDANSVNISGGAVMGITDITVADGGTGRSAHTAYTVLCGGTTTTAAQQSVAAVGATGQSLVSAGAAALPAFGWPTINRNFATFATNSTYTTPFMVLDDSIPQITEGSEIVTCSITPRSASSRLRITVSVPMFTASGALTIVAALFRDANANAVFTATQKVLATGDLGHMAFTWEESSASTSSTTFRLRMGPPSGTLYVNALDSGARLFGGVVAVTMVVEEVG